MPGLAGAVTGALLYVASPGVDVWPAVFIALIPLMLVVERASFRRSLLEGLVGGILLFAPGLSWLPEFFRSAFLAGAGFAWLAYTGIVVLSSMKLCLGCAMAWLLLRTRANVILAFGCSFAAGELALPGLVPYTISASLHSVSPLLQVAEWGGSTWIVALLAAVNATLAAVVKAESWGARARASSLAAALVLAWLGCGLWLRERARASVAGANAPVRILMVQPAITAHLKQTQPSHVVALYRDATERALAADRADRADWVVWGESAVASAVDETRLEHALRTRTRGGLGIPLLTGAVLRGAEGKLYNSAVSVDATGQVCARCRYDKQRLVPLVEQRPAGLNLVEGSSASPPTFDRGSDAASPVQIGDHAVAVAICYEALFASDFRKRASKQGTELLVSLASDLRLSSGRAEKLHMALIQLRAIEHRKFLIHATVGAESAAIDPLGSVDAQSNAASTAVKFANVQWLRSSTLWSRVGDLPFWALFGILALASAVRFRASRASTA